MDWTLKDTNVTVARKHRTELRDIKSIYVALIMKSKYINLKCRQEEEGLKKQRENVIYHKFF